MTPGWLTGLLAILFLSHVTAMSAADPCRESLAETGVTRGSGVEWISTRRLSDIMSNSEKGIRREAGADLMLHQRSNPRVKRARGGDVKQTDQSLGRRTRIEEATTTSTIK